MHARACLSYFSPPRLRRERDKKRELNPQGYDVETRRKEGRKRGRGVSIEFVFSEKTVEALCFFDYHCTLHLSTLSQHGSRDQREIPAVSRRCHHRGLRKLHCSPVERDGGT